MKRKWTLFTCMLGMAVLILDSKTALTAANEGVQLCVQTVIPSLFPLIVLTNVLNSELLGAKMGVLSPAAKLLRIPQHAVSIVLAGFCGGYPMGAACISSAVKNGALDRNDGKRMLGFSSNCGPAFVFGMGAHLFPKLWICFLAWGIHVISALIVGMLTSGQSREYAKHSEGSPLTFSQALQKSLRIMCSICGWIVLFRIVIGFADRWVLWFADPAMRAVIAGFLEISNGVCALDEVGNIGSRLTIFCALISFGGICVWMQTSTVCEDIPTTLYFPGKLVQSAISILLCMCLQPIFPHNDRCDYNVLLIVVCTTVCVLYVMLTKKYAKSIGNCPLPVV